jgi:hypothetical protein
MKTAFLLLLVLLMPRSLVVKVAGAEATPAISDPWEAIKYKSYEKRTEFAAGTGRLVGKLDEQIRQLNEKRATLPETSVKEWDFAMKGLIAARSYLKSVIAELGEVTSETWDQSKDKIGRAWQDAQEACNKVKSSTTS